MNRGFSGKGRIERRLAALLLVAAACTSSSHSQKPDGRRTNIRMKIQLAWAGSAAPVRMEEGIPVFALGTPVSLIAKYTNDGGGTVHIDSPKTSQDVLLWLVTQSRSEPYWFMMNRSVTDPSGETTAPMPVQIALAPGRSFDVEFKLQDYSVDKWFDPGWVEVYLTYLGEKSQAVKFGTEFTAESVPQLVRLALESRDLWIRERSIAFLEKMPDKPGLALPRAGASAKDNAALETRNRERAEEFGKRWAQQRDTQPMQKFFESVRIKAAGR